MRSRVHLDRSTWLVLIGLLIAAVAYAVYMQLQPPLPRVGAYDSQRSIGPANAPVTIIEYGDFGCTTCLSWYRAGVQQRILSTYGDKVRFVWRDFPVITVYSPKAAEAGLCAAVQGKFWAFHDAAYNHAPAITVPDLKTYAAQLGLDTAQFDTCLDSGRFAGQVQANLKSAQQAGFFGPPVFDINGNLLNGSLPFSAFSHVIDPLIH